MSNFLSTSGRKVLVTVLILAAGLAVALIKGDLPHNLLALLEVIFAGFVSGNAVEHLARISEARQKAASSGALPPEITADQIRQSVQILDQRLASIEQQTSQLGEAQNVTNQAVSALLDSVK
jgi:hypothetical protein